MIPLPDLLFPHRHAGSDPRLLEELLEMSFLGGDTASDLDTALTAVALPPSSWSGEAFGDGLFLPELIETAFALEVDGRRFPVHRRYVERVLGQPPTDRAAIAFRQRILGELAASPELRARAERLFVRLFNLLSAFKAPGGEMDADGAVFRLEVLRQVQAAVDQMVEGFAGCESGLRRLHEVGLEIRATREMGLLAALLDHEGHLSDLTVRLRLGADGRIRRLTVDGIADNGQNPFHRSPARRWLDRARLVWRGLDVDRREVVNRLILAVYAEIAPTLRSILQVLGQLELYLGALGFADRAGARGLEVSVAEWTADGEALSIERLFNPLLFRQVPHPVPCDLAPANAEPIVLVTGANSGGKTRMLQALGIAQLLGQSGLFVPARRARLPLARGLFVSLVEQASADEPEGRLGAELLRIRRLFEEIHPHSVVLIDELCSGTNPSEAIRIIGIVLELLRRSRAIAFVTTHFLDYTHELAATPPWPELEFLQALASPTSAPTYQFAEGVANSSLAAETARRLGVTSEALHAVLDERFGEAPRR